MLHDCKGQRLRLFAFKPAVSHGPYVYITVPSMRGIYVPHMHHRRQRSDRQSPNPRCGCGLQAAPYCHLQVCLLIGWAWRTRRMWFSQLPVKAELTKGLQAWCTPALPNGIWAFALEGQYLDSTSRTSHIWKRCTASRRRSRVPTVVANLTLSHIETSIQFTMSPAC